MHARRADWVRLRVLSLMVEQKAWRSLASALCSHTADRLRARSGHAARPGHRPLAAASSGLASTPKFALDTETFHARIIHHLRRCRWLLRS